MSGDYTFAGADLAPIRPTCADCKGRASYTDELGVELCGPCLRHRRAQGAVAEVRPAPGAVKPSAPLAALVRAASPPPPAPAEVPMQTETPAAEPAAVDPGSSPPPPPPARARTMCGWPGCSTPALARRLCARDRYRYEAMGLDWDVAPDEAARRWDEREAEREAAAASKAEAPAVAVDGVEAWKTLHAIAHELGVTLDEAKPDLLVLRARTLRVERDDGYDFQRRLNAVNDVLDQLELDGKDKLEEAAVVKRLGERERWLDEVLTVLNAVMGREGEAYAALPAAVRALREQALNGVEARAATVRAFVDEKVATGGDLQARLDAYAVALHQWHAGDVSPAGVEVLGRRAQLLNEVVLRLNLADGTADEAVVLQALDRAIAGHAAAGRVVLLHMLDGLPSPADFEAVAAWTPGRLPERAFDRTVYYLVGAAMSAGELYASVLLAGDRAAASRTWDTMNEIVQHLEGVSHELLAGEGA